MDKCREAFERHQAKLLNINYEDLKEQFDRHEKCFSKRYAAFSDFEKEFAIWEACWQSRQAEVDELQANLDRADEIATRENNRANKLQEDNTSTTILLGKTIVKKEALEASIAKALVKWNSIVSILTTSHVKVPDEVFQKLDELEKALRGEHE